MTPRIVKLTVLTVGQAVVFIAGAGVGATSVALTAGPTIVFVAGVGVGVVTTTYAMAKVAEKDNVENRD